jgi:hypothetical protein
MQEPISRGSKNNHQDWYKVSKRAQVIKEMDRYNIAIVGISKCRWVGTGNIASSGHTIILPEGLMTST